MGFTPAVSSTDTELYRTVRQVTLEYSATATPAEDSGAVHGNDERVTEINVRRGVEMTLAILERFAATRPVMEDH